jgi:hypothetical protein
MELNDILNQLTNVPLDTTLCGQSAPPRSLHSYFGTQVGLWPSCESTGSIRGREKSQYLVSFQSKRIMRPVTLPDIEQLSQPKSIRMKWGQSTGVLAVPITARFSHAPH